MSKPTPGPWLAATKPEQEHRVFFIYHDDGSRFLPALEIATIYSAGNDNAKADARLIAAAPEMLEALKDAIKWQDEDSYDGMRADLYEKRIAKWRAAIAKATGAADGEGE